MDFLKQLIHYNQLLVNSPAFLFSVTAIILSIVLASFKQYRPAVAVLTIGSFILNWGIIHLDPFLNSWDERFHTLVAKNMATYPFRPMLYVEPLLPYDIANWSGNHIWVHKQPFFLWQMALSIKLFGVNEVAARLPSAVMVSILAVVLFRVGSLLSGKRVGYIAALLCISNNFILEHVSGKQELDHNDLAFFFYVTLSIWAWIEHEKSGKRWWLILAGLFSGFAILIKWLTALIVFGGYGFYHLLMKKDLLKKENVANLALSLLCTAAVAVPWQLYIMFNFPAEAQHEYDFNVRHFKEPLDGHAGPAWIYLQELGVNYSILYPLIFAGMVIVFLRVSKHRLYVPLVVMIFVFYAFFSMAATKMSSFVMPMAPLCFLFMALAVDFVLQYLDKYKYAVAGITTVVLALMFFQNLHIGKLAGNHWRNPDSYWGKFAQNTADNTVIYKNLNAVLNDNYVIAYCNQYEEIDCMFYSGITAYSYLDKQRYNQLKNSGKKIAAFKNNLPDFVINDPDVYLIPVAYKSN